MEVIAENITSRRRNSWCLRRSPGGAPLCWLPPPAPSWILRRLKGAAAAAAAWSCGSSTPILSIHQVQSNLCKVVQGDLLTATFHLSSWPDKSFML
jgi:hypothetical protein